MLFIKKSHLKNGSNKNSVNNNKRNCNYQYPRKKREVMEKSIERSLQNEGMKFSESLLESDSVNQKVF